MLITLPAHRREPRRLRAGREARALDDHHRAAVADVEPLLAARLDEQRRAATGSTGRRPRRASSPGRRRTCRARPLVRSTNWSQTTNVPGGTSRAQRARGARADDAAHAELAQRPHVGAVRDAVRRQLVVAAVARQERDAHAAHVADARCESDGGAVRRVDGDLLDVVEERVEPRAAEDADVARAATQIVAARRPDLGPRRHRAPGGWRRRSAPRRRRAPAAGPARAPCC